MGEWLRTVDWRPGGPGFESCCGNFASELWQILRLPRCANSLSEETLKVAGPFYLVSMPGEVKKNPTSSQLEFPGNVQPVVDSTTPREGKL